MKEEKIVNPKTDGKISVEVKSPEKGIERVVGTMKSKTDRELFTEGRLRVKYEKKDAKKVANKIVAEFNQRKNDEKAELEKICAEKKCVVMKGKNKSKVATERIIEEGALMGVEVSVEDARLVKKEIRLQEKIVTNGQAVHYFKTMEQRVGAQKKGLIIILVIWIIKAKCPMPVPAMAYQIKAKALAAAQTADTLGYFIVPFPGLALMITHVGDLLTAIEAFEDPALIGTLVDVEAAVALVKISVDALIAYVNTKTIVNQTLAPSIIENAGMEQVKEKAKNTKADFTVRQGEGTGNIVLTSLAGKFNNKPVNTTYYWQYGLMTPTGMQWYDLPDTINQCTTIATGMSTTQSVSFRKSTFTKKGGRSAWSPPIAISPA